MPRRPDMPCADCGKLMWRGKGVLPEGQARCRECRKARPARASFDPSKCGTPRGRDQHRHRGEAPCDPCREAWNAISRERMKRLHQSGYVRPSRSEPKFRRLDSECSDCGKAIKAALDTPLCSSCRLRDKRGIYIRPADRLAIYERDAWSCGFCSEPVNPDAKHPDPWAASLDHIVPRSKGGSDDVENLRLLHRYCNGVRSNRDALTLAELTT